MATPKRAARLFVAVAAFSTGAGAACAQPTTMPSASVSGISSTRPEFTRPAGIPGSARMIAGEGQYMLAPGQPTGAVVRPKKPKRR